MYVKSIPNSLTTIAKTNYNLNEEKIEIYSYIFEQLSNNNFYYIIKEINHLVSSGNNPNQIIINLINDNPFINDLFDDFIKNKLELFSEQDLYERFFT